MVGTSLKHSPIFLGALLLSSSMAWAVAGDVPVSKTLNTAALFADAGKTYHACVVTNVTTANATVKVDLLNSGGIAEFSSGTTPVTIPPGEVYEVTQGLSETYTGFARCRFLVYSGNDDAIRANQSVFFYTGAYYQTLAVSDAR